MIDIKKQQDDVASFVTDSVAERSRAAERDDGLGGSERVYYGCTLEDLTFAYIRLTPPLDVILA